MSTPPLSDIVEVAARATINARCASAYLHDVRGSLQALYSAMELLSRSARSGGDNTAKVERACDLARRAIGSHEKSTLELLQLLTSTHSVAIAFDLHQLITDVIHFLRNECAMRSVDIAIVSHDKPFIHADRSKFQILMVGLLTAAIDATAPGSKLFVDIEQEDEFGVVALSSTAGYDEALAASVLLQELEGRVQPHQLTFVFARKYLAEVGGKLVIGHSRTGHSTLRVHYPRGATESA